MNQLATPRLGVAGAGAWGRNIVRTCARAGVLGAICDANAPALAALAAGYPDVATTCDYHELLRMPIDAVVIAAPAQQHTRMALEAIDAGKHVFVEKPFALEPDEAIAIVARAKSRGVQCFAGHLLLYHPAVEEVLRRVADGAIGEIRHIRSRRLGFGRLRDYENAWWSFAPHDVAVMLALTRQLPIDCTAVASCVTDSDLADFCYADYTFNDRLTAHIEVGWLDPVRSHRLDVIGTGGALTFIDSRNGAYVLQNTRVIAINERGGREARAAGNCRIPFRSVEPLRVEIDAFVRTIQTGIPAPSDGRSAIGVTIALAMASACALTSNVTAIGA